MVWITVERWRERTRRLKREVTAVYLAARDHRTPWYAKLLAIGIVAYALSPLDLIPDPIPVLGYLDDLIVLPLAILLVLRLIPEEVMDDARHRAAETPLITGPVGWIGAGIVAVLWVLLLVVTTSIVVKLVQGNRI